MPKHVLIELDEDEHRRLRRIKNRYDMTWQDVLERGVQGLEDPGEVPEPGAPPEPEP